MISQVGLESSTYAELPGKFEAGTSAITEVVGLGAAVDYLSAIGMDAVRAHESDLTAYALERLPELEGLRIFGPADAESRGGVISFELEGIHPHDLAEICDRSGVCIRAGHHCAQPLMRELGVSATARASFHVYNDREDVDRLVELASGRAKGVRPLMDSLYRDYILDHYKNPRNFGTLEPHDLEHHDHNPLCGDELGVHLVTDGEGTITDLRFHGQGCAISQASASIASEELIGMKADAGGPAGRRLGVRPAGDPDLPHPAQVRAAEPEGHARRRHRRCVLARVASLKAGADLPIEELCRPPRLPASWTRG
ncbi:MAG: aminotransferase class V-fold PLP-dependent enzyme [Thermoleophilaceae bacterium]